MSPSRAANAPSRTPIACWRMSGAAIRALPEVSLDQISEQLGLGGRPRHERRLALRPRACGARDQAGARRHDRGDLPGSRLPRHPAALRRHRAGRYRRHAGAAADLLDLQGYSGRPDPRAHLRLHPSPARSRSSAEGFVPEAPAAAEASTARDAARHRHSRPRRPDRALAAGRRRRQVGDLTREPLDFPADRDLRLQNLARGDEGFLLALGYSTQRGYGRNHPFAGEIRFGEVEVEFVGRGRRLRGAARLDRADRMPDGQPVQGLGHGSAVLHPRLWAGVRPERAQDHVDGAGRPRAARPRARRGGRSPRRRTRNS